MSFLGRKSRIEWNLVSSMSNTIIKLKKYNLSETLQVQRVDNFVSDNRLYEKNLKIRVQLVTGDLMNG